MSKAPPTKNKLAIFLPGLLQSEDRQHTCMSLSSWFLSDSPPNSTKELASFASFTINIQPYPVPMAALSFLKKLETAPAACFIVLDSIKSKRMGGAKTLYTPSVEQVAESIRTIPKGETRTIEQVRATLATMGGADTACPAKTIKYWKWMASLADEVNLANPAYDIPWWRVLKDGKPSRHMPGGIENQKWLLESEKVIVE